MTDPFSTSLALEERSVLGGMMLSKRVIWDVLDVVVADDFADARHADIFRAIFELAHENQPTDVLAVSAKLQRDGDLERVGGASALHSMCGEVPTAANAGYYAGLVKQAAIKRRLVEAGMRIVAMGNASEGDAFELAEAARAELDATANVAAVDVSPIGDSVPDVVESLRHEPRYWPTPWEHVNGLINGLRPGALYAIGARPGAGKTIMGLMLAEMMAHYGAVAMSSLEMDTADLTKRMIAMKGSIHMTALTRSVLTPKDWETIAAVRPKIASLPLFVDDRSGVTVTQIKAHARSVSRRQPLAAVVVDYVQLIVSNDSKQPRHVIVGEITRQLKIMARELQVPVIMLAQLNRGTESQGLVQRLPNLSDLRESGSIENDSDVVLLLQRKLDADGEPTEDLDVVVAKNRHGSTGKVTLLWEGHFARVSTMPW